ncbi:hypothetical protein DJ031_09585 [bacterium endosymbiont of Escarpia laminata]|nr:MAG: hypothetical protein DJ031_09585 [bacterium endosymbiont of Escarpia laminata]
MDIDLSDLLKPRLLPLVLASISFAFLLYMVGDYFRFLVLKQFTLQQHFVDGSTYVSHIATRYTPTEKLTIVMLGGSVTREGTLPDGKVEQMWHEAYGIEIDFINLGSSSQTIFESLALLATMDTPKKFIVVQQFSYKKLDSGPDLLRQEYLSPRMTYLDYSSLESYLSHSDHFLRTFMPDLLLYAGPIRQYLGERECSLIALLSMDGRIRCFRNKKVKRRYYADKESMTFDKKKSYVLDMQRDIIPNYEKNAGFNIVVMKEMSRLVKERGGKLVFAIYPFDDAENELNKAITGTDRYRELAGELAGNIFFDIQQAGSFSDKDFYDSQHMTSSGKTRFSRLLIEDIHAIVSGENQ